jgi:hypothetical protein
MRRSAECEKLYPNRTQKPVMPRIRCFNDAIMAYQLAHERSTGNPNLDLARAMTAQMLVVGERYDKGAITEAQFEADKANVHSEYVTKVARRQNEAAMVGAARTQAVAAQQQAIAASMPVTCNRFGNTVTCY